MQRIAALMIASIVALIALFAVMTGTDSANRSEIDSDVSILLHCAASNRAVMESIRADYEQEFGRSVQIQYGPSQTLLSSIEVSRQGDLYLPADDSYLTLGKSKELINETIPIAQMQAGLVVSRSNPKGIRSLDDLLRDDVRFVMANPETAAIGKLTRREFRKLERWDDLERVAKAQRATVNEVANDVAVGAADVGIVYNAVLHTYSDLEFVEIPELGPAASAIAIGVLESSRHPTEALHFARYVSARDRGLKHYRDHGFGVQGGDLWRDHPELSIFAGSMLRPAIDETITAFEQREGVTVHRVYNGCGILVAQMKAGQEPDAYFACDLEFMNQVHDLFPEPVSVSQNELVILVPKGNPKGIKSLKDLARPDVAVGIGHEKQCAMGWITQNTFREGGVSRRNHAERKNPNANGRYVGQPIANGVSRRGRRLFEQCGRRRGIS